jgi:hypothetical protein
MEKDKTILKELSRSQLWQRNFITSVVDLQNGEQFSKFKMDVQANLLCNKMLGD